MSSSDLPAPQYQPYDAAGNRYGESNLKPSKSGELNLPNSEPLPTPAPEGEAELRERIGRIRLPDTHVYSTNDLTIKNLVDTSLAEAILHLVQQYAVLAELNQLYQRLSDLAYACGYTDNQPFLANQKRLVEERIAELQAHQHEAGDGS